MKPCVLYIFVYTLTLGIDVTAEKYIIQDTRQYKYFSFDV